MKSRWFLLVALAGLGVIALVSCGGGSPTCADDALVAPVLGDPAMWGQVNSLTPTLTWTYPDNNCHPEGYRIELRTGPSFADDLSGGTGNPSTSWSPGDPLEPGREYEWGVQAINGTTLGPFAGFHYFFTGPNCAADNLEAPILLSPLNNWTYHDLNDLEMMWVYPNTCLPGSYGVELSNSLVFSGSPLNGGTGNPSTRWVPGQPLADCNRFYWRVRAFKDGNPGPYSQVYTFRLAISGGCPAETTGLIQGTVWQDQCVGPGPGTPVNGPAPYGCVYTDEDALFTNQTYDPGEPGIGNLIVTLGQGACPSTGYREVATGEDGTFNFYTLPAGTYCVSVDLKEPINNSILWPGLWTVPAEDVGFALADQTVTLAAGQNLNNVNFGWWYKIGTAWGNQANARISGTIWQDQCSLPPDADPVPDPLPDGCVFDNTGVHADGIMQEGETRLAGLTVEIGQGDCPSAGFATAVTDVNGIYAFPSLNPGKYCIRVNADDPANASVLGTGMWTLVPSGNEGKTYRAVHLNFGQVKAGQDFAWWNYPSGMIFIPNVNAYCRLGPDPVFNSVTLAMKGQPYPIDGRNLENDWYFLRISDTVECWVPADTGTASGDTSGVRVMLTIPTPTFTLPPAVGGSCSQYKNSRDCYNNGCTWVPSTTTAPYCH